MSPLSPTQDESLTFQGQLDSLEAEILRHRKELHSLQVLNNDAQLSKEAAKVTFDLWPPHRGMIPSPLLSSTLIYSYMSAVATRAFSVFLASRQQDYSKMDKPISKKLKGGVLPNE